MTSPASTPKPASPKKEEALISTIKENTATLTKFIERASEHKSENKWKIAEVSGLWAAAIVGLIAIFFGNLDAHHQRQVMLDQLNEAKAQSLITMSQLRARLVIEPHIIPEMKENGEIYRYSDTIYFRNTGFTDAINYKGSIEKRIFNKGEKINFKEMNSSLTIRDGNGLPLAPSQTNLLITQYFTNDEILSAEKGDVQLWIYGKIIYNDVFPSTPIHEQAFCYMLVPQPQRGGIGFSSVNGGPECNYAR